MITKKLETFNIVVENPGPGVAQLQIQRTGQAGPSQDYLAVGKEVQALVIFKEQGRAK